MKPETRIALAEKVGIVIREIPPEKQRLSFCTLITHEVRDTIRTDRTPDGFRNMEDAIEGLPDFESYDSGSRLLVEKLREEGWRWMADLNHDGRVAFTFTKLGYMDNWHLADTLPLAISRAACRVWGIKEDGE